MVLMTTAMLWREGIMILRAGTMLEGGHYAVDALLPGGWYLWWG